MGGGKVMSGKKEWCVWSHEHQAWWREESRGYCTDPLGAGRYTKKEAEACCNSRSKEQGKLDPEIMVHESKLPLSDNETIKYLNRSLEVAKDRIARLENAITLALRTEITLGKLPDNPWKTLERALEDTEEQ